MSLESVVIADLDDGPPEGGPVAALEWGIRNMVQEEHSLEGEELITLTEASRLLPNRPHPASVWRACRRGLKARNGKRVHLEHIRCFNRIMTSRKALFRFWTELSRQDAEHFNQVDEREHEKARPTRRLANRRTRELAASKQRLLEKGI